LYFISRRVFIIIDITDLNYERDVKWTVFSEWTVPQCYVQNSVSKSRTRDVTIYI